MKIIIQFSAIMIIIKPHYKPSSFLSGIEYGTRLSSDIPHVELIVSLQHSIHFDTEYVNATPYPQFLSPPRAILFY